MKHVYHLMQAEFLSELRQKAKRKGVDLEEFLEEKDPKHTGRMPASQFRNILANVNFFVDDEKFDYLLGDFNEHGTFYYRDYIEAVDSMGKMQPKPALTPDQLLDFGRPLRDRGIDLIDFCRRWDHMRTGRISQTIFLQNVSSTPLAQLVCQQYSNPVTRDVEYVRLAQDIEKVLTSPQQQASARPAEIPKCMTVIAQSFKIQGVNPMSIFIRLDRFKRNKIQPSVFLSEFSNYNLPITPQDLDSVASAYSIGGQFDYIQFCNEIQRINEDAAKKAAPPAPKKLNPDEILNRLSTEVVQRHSSIGQQIAQLDTSKSGFVSFQRVARLLATGGFSLNEQEIDCLGQCFGDGRGGFDYITFLDQILPPAPSTVNIEDLLIRLQDHLASKRVQIKPILSKYDTRGTGSVSYSQLLSTLRSLEFDMTNDEIAILKQGFAKDIDTVDYGNLCELVDPYIEPPKKRPPPPKIENVQPAKVALDVLTKLSAIEMKYGIDLQQEIAKFDPTRRGRVPAGIFASAIKSLPYVIADTEIQSLVDFYRSSTGDVNYETFIQDMTDFGGSRVGANPQLINQILADAPIAPVSATDVIHRLKLHLSQQHLQPDTLFTKFDTNRSGTIPCVRLNSIFQDIGFDVTRKELDTLTDTFQDARMPERFNYKKFVQAVAEDQVTKKDLQVTSARVNVTDQDTLIAITELREKLLARHKRIRSAFSGITDPAMSAMQFRRCIESFGLVLKESDIQKILRSYRVNMQGDIDWQTFCRDVESSKTI